MGIALPLTCQNTGTWTFSEVSAVQATDLLEATVSVDALVAGSTQTTELIFVGCRIVTLAVAVRVVCAWAIAVIVTILLVGTAFGAVYRPFASMVPKVELPLATPPACQLTKVLLKLRMVAVHCTVPFTATEDAAQEAVIVGVGGGALEPPPQEFRVNSAGRSTKIRRRRRHLASRRQIEPFN